MSHFHKFGMHLHQRGTVSMEVSELPPPVSSSQAGKGGPSLTSKPNIGSGCKADALFQAPLIFKASHSKKEFWKTENKIVSLIPLCERHNLEFRRLTD